MPPCLDSLKKHAQRASYQSEIWERNLELHPDTPTPNGTGWKLIIIDDKEQLTIDRMDGLPAPQTLLDLLYCKCSKGCKLPKFICLINGLNFSEMCTGCDCTNKVSDTNSN